MELNFKIEEDIFLIVIRMRDFQYVNHQLGFSLYFLYFFIPHLMSSSVSEEVFFPFNCYLGS